MTGTDRSEIFTKIREYLDHYLKTMTLMKRNRAVAERSLLYHDLGMRGFDANDFLCFLVDEFEVDLAEFRFHTYFHDENYGVVEIARILFGLYDKSKKPITVGHMVDVCVAKKWTAPPE
jgi:hypothetical protein